MEVSLEMVDAPGYYLTYCDQGPDTLIVAQHFATGSSYFFHLQPTVQVWIIWNSAPVNMNWRIVITMFCRIATNMQLQTCLRYLSISQKTRLLQQLRIQTMMSFVSELLMVWNLVVVFAFIWLPQRSQSYRFAFFWRISKIAILAIFTRLVQSKWHETVWKYGVV